MGTKQKLPPAQARQAVEKIFSDPERQKRLADGFTRRESGESWPSLHEVNLVPGEIGPTPMLF